MYTEQSFSFGELRGLSAKQLEEHLKLYKGYVTHTNLILDKIADLSSDREKNGYVIGELQRRLGFEFNGMRMHEYYFEQFAKQESGPESLAIHAALEKRFGSFEKWREAFSALAMTRGTGWSILGRDPKTDTLHSVWVGDHELGQLAGVDIIIALDMWEHAFMVDYLPSEKKQYVSAFFDNLDWEIIEKRFKK